MFNTKRYDINKFYVGELYLSYEFGNLLLPDPYTIESKNDKKEIDNTILNGAIAFQTGSSRYIDWENRRFYDGMLTIFYRDSDGYICLHNGKKYNTEGFNFCKNLMPLTNVLPTIGFNQPIEISLIESIELFKKLFIIKEKGLSRKMYDKTLYNLDDFYVGNLNLFEGVSEEFIDGRSEQYKYFNSIEKRLLFKSDAKIICFFGSNSQIYPYKALDYINFKTLFLKLDDENYYSLHNFSVYPKVNSYDEESKKNSLGESYCGGLQSFRNLLINNKVVLKKSQITIPKALKLYKKIK